MDADIDEPERICPHCGEEVDRDDLACSTCGEPLDDPSRGICGFCGVATNERCASCHALVCWECSDGSRRGEDELHAGVPYCPDCSPSAGAA
jgi:hypothetical protein